MYEIFLSISRAYKNHGILYKQFVYNNNKFFTNYAYVVFLTFSMTQHVQKVYPETTVSSNHTDSVHFFILLYAAVNSTTKYSYYSLAFSLEFMWLAPKKHT